MELYSFEKLNAYQEARKLVVMVYRVIETLPNNERYALGTQLQRAIISVTSNIAEGTGRMSYKEKIHFLEISFGSLMESYCQLQTCMDLGYITVAKFHAIKPQFFVVSRLLHALRQSYIDILNKQTTNKP